MLRLALLSLLLLGFPAPGSAKDPSYLRTSAPDIEAFMQIGFNAATALSPDGRTLWFTSNSPGVTQVFRLDRVTGWPYQLTVFPDGVTFATVSPDASHLIVGVGAGGDENAQLWLLDAYTGEAEALTASPEVRHFQPVWSPDGSWISFASNEENGTDFFVYRYDLATREKERISDLPGYNSPAEIAPDGRRMVLWHAESNADIDLYLLDLATGRRELLTPTKGDRAGGGAFSADGERIYLISNDNPDGIDRLAVLDLESGKRTFLEPDNPWEVGSLALSRDRSVLAWTVNEDGYTRLRLRDLSTGRALPVPPVDGQVGGPVFADDNSFAFTFASATSTNDVWYWDGAAPKLEKLTHATYAGVDPTRFRAPELVRIESFDGLEIPAFLYLPPDRREGEAVPFVLHMHGGPESQFQPDFIRHFQYLMLNGYGILAPNVRGSSGYGKEYMDLDNYTKRLDSVKDMKACADWLVAQGYSAPGMLAVKGGSYGGYMTMAGITEYPDLFSAAINDVGITNFVTFLENTADYRRALREAEYGPLTDREFLESISPLNKADDIRTPLLVIHGENDPRVPVSEARQIGAAIEANGGAVELLIFPDEGHGVAKRPNVLTSYRKQVEFLNEHLKPATPPESE